MKLWPFQEESKVALRDNFRRGVKRQILCSPTGSGKTEIAMSIVRDMANKGTRCMFVVDRQTLVRQTSARFSAAGIMHGMMMGADTVRQHERIQVCSAQTLEKRGWPPMPDLVFFDECHEIRTSLVQDAVTKGMRVVGLSATPLTLGLDKWYQEIVNVTTTTTLIKDGYLAPLKIVGPTAIVDTEDLSVAAGEWKKNDLSDRVLRIVGDIVPTWKEKTDKYFGGPVQTIVFCPSVSDSCRTADAFTEAGYDFQVVHYKQSSLQKQEIIERFRREKHIGLVSCVALTKGFDVPGTRCMVDAYPLRSSLAMHIQKLGRVMRRADGKEYGLVIDHAENYTRFYDDATEFFDNGCTEFMTSERKKEKKKAKKRKVQPRRCDECQIILAPTVYVCPECGKEYQTSRDASIVRESATMELVAELIGKAHLAVLVDSGTPEDPSWWWDEMCAAATIKCAGDQQRARRRAYATYKSTFKEWPKSPFRALTREPHPAAMQLLDASFQRWKKRRPR